MREGEQNLKRFDYLIKLSKHVEGMRLYFAAIVSVNLAFKTTPLIISVLSAYLVSSALLGDYRFTRQIIAIILVLAVLSGILAYLDVLISHDVTYHILTKFRNAAYDKIDEITPAAMEAILSGDAVSIILEDIELLEQFYAHIIAQLIVAFMLPMGSLIALGFINPLFLISTVPFTIALMLVPIRAAKAADSQGVRTRVLFGEMNARAVE